MENDITQTTDRVALIKSHSLNEIRHAPLSVTANDRLFLVGEVERLRAWLSYIEGNFRDGRECAAEALRGDAPPEGFAP